MTKARIPAEHLSRCLDRGGWVPHRAGYRPGRDRAVQRDPFAAEGGVFVNLDLVVSATPQQHERFRHAIGRPQDDPADRLVGLCEQLDWLKDAGFTEVGCRFKWMELMLIVAVTPKRE